MKELPSAPGSYLLALRLETTAAISVGRLGTHRFLPGVYLYAGSAHGPGGVRARLGRHLRGNGRPRWHVDFLRAHTTPLAWAWKTIPGPWECRWSQALAELPEVSVPVAGFGASDCRHGCPAHLLFCAWDDWPLVWRAWETGLAC